MDNDKIDQHSDEIEVESEEKERGKKIEIDEDRLPSRAMAIHEHIRQDGEKELERDAMALLWSAIAAGLSMGASLLAKGIFHVELEGVPGSFLPGESRLYLWFYYRHNGPPAIIYRKHRDCGTTRHAKTDNEQRWLTYAVMGSRAAG